MIIRIILVLNFLLGIGFFSYAQTTSVTLVNGNPYCTASSNSFTLNYSKTGTYTAGNVFTAQLSDPSGSFAAPMNIGTLASVNNGTISCIIPAGTTAGTGYRIRVVSSAPVATVTTDNGTNLSVTAAPGNPAVYGNGMWNVYGYNGSAFNTYAGFYTETNTNFNTTSRYATNSTPSNVVIGTGAGYSGCTITGTLYSLAYKRTNFPCGVYVMDIPTQDDNSALLINSVQVAQFNGAGTVHMGVWTGFVDPSMTVEVDLVNTMGNGYISFNANTSAVAAPLALAATNAANQCTSFNANWNAFNFATSYYLDVATDNAFTAILPAYNNLNVGNVLTYPITGLTLGTTYYYRIRAYSSTCVLTTGSSNTISYTTYTPTPVTVTPSSPTICAGNSVTLTAANAAAYSWSPSAGLSATTGARVVATPAGATTYTVTGTSAQGCVTSANATVSIYAAPPGNPAVFGNGAWNVYGYNATNFTNYSGFYTENNLSFNTTTRFVSGNTPSNANNLTGLPYTGCTINANLFSLAYKRTNIACGIYSLDITYQDDNSAILINGSQVFQFNGWNTSHTGAWVGFIDPSTTVEVDLVNTAGPGSIGFNTTNSPSSVPVALAATNAADQCTSFNANWTTFNASNYYLDVATDNAFTAILPAYNGLDVSNVLTYPVTGLTLGTTYYYRIRAYSSACALTSGYSNTISYTTYTPTPVTVTPSTPTICAGNSVTLTAANAVAYSWSPSAGLSATTGATVVATPAGAANYTVTGTSAQGCVSSATAAISIYAAPPGNPAVFGNGIWNVYGYNSTNYTSYQGFYTENSLNFNTTTRYVNNTAPSTANGSSGLPYAGCTLPNINYSITYKRTSIPCGYYSLDIPYHDDNATVVINGTQVFQHNGCCDSHFGIWAGFIDPTTNVEVDLINFSGPGQISFNANNVPAATPVALAATNAANQCTGFNANWTYFNASNYYLDVATDNAFTSILPGYNGLDVSNVLTYPVTGLTLGTTYYYRVRAYSSVCALTSGYSNTISYTTFTPTPITVTPSSPTICAGNSVTLTAANAATYSWSPSSGLSAATGATVVATPAGATTYTVTGTSAQGCVTSANATVSIYAAPPGNPAVFGNGFWNVYGYNGTAFNTYAGFYTENNLNFHTTTRYLSGSTPSNANGSSGLPYTGCTISGTSYSLAHKITNVACGIYSLDITYQDDNSAILINGSQVFQFNGWNTSHIGAWVGFIDPSTTVEVDLINTAGPGSISFNTTNSPSSVPVALAATNATNQCTSFNANWFTFNASNYYLDVATDNAFTAILPAYNNLNVGNVLTYPVTGLISGTTYYYRIRAYSSACVLTSGSSNTISYTTGNLPNVTITNPAAVCSPTNVNLTAGAVTSGSTGGLTYTYWTDAGAASTLASPGTISVSNTYYIKGTNGAGCYVIKPVIATINPKPTVTTSNTAAVCSGIAANIGLTSSPAGASFAWTLGTVTGTVSGQSASSGTTIAQTLTSAAGGTVKYIVTPTLTGCSGAAYTITVTVSSTPGITTASTATICNGATTSIILASSPAGSSFAWTIGTVTGSTSGQSASSGTSIAQALTGAGTVPYIVTPTLGSCSGNPYTITVTVQNPIVVTHNPAIACSPSTINLTLAAVTAGSTAGLTYTYWKDAAATVVLPSPNAVSTIGTYYIKGTDAFGCKYITSVYVNSVVPNASPNTSTWTGSTSTDWFDATNWCGIVPTATQSAYIPGSGITNMPLISGANAISKNLTLVSGAILNVASNENLNIYGNWTNNGVFNTGTGSVSFVGSATDTIAGSGTNTFYNLVLNNSSASGDALILKSSISVNNNLTLSNGIINSTPANILTMNSGSATSVGNSRSYIDGPMNYIVASTGPSSINFPLGSGSTIWDPATMNNLTQSTNAPQVYTARLINSSPYALGYGIDPTLHDISNLRYWQFSSAGSNTVSTQMTFYYNTYDQVSDYTNLTVGGTNAGGSYWNNLNGTATANVAGTITTSIPTTSFGDFTLANIINGANALPIGLIDFKATVSNPKQVLVQWSTINETNNNYFTIEESKDGTTFHDIGYVNGDGNSTTIHNYSFPDFAPLDGVSYYRLKQTDFNGHITYSAIQSVTINESVHNDKGFVILPNPTDMDHIYIRFAEPNADQWEFQFIDTYGRALGTQSIPSNNSSIGDLLLKPNEYLASGMYIVIATTRNRQYVEKLIIK